MIAGSIVIAFIVSGTRFLDFPLDADKVAALRFVAIDDVDYFRSDAKYTIVAWRDAGKPAEAVVRTPLKELLGQLDAEQFAQVHRSVVVSLRAISHVKRHDNETAEIHLKGRPEVLPVSRHYLHLFRQM